jgi:teichuronic acid biosynthesis glycosyltransferase TuaH
MIEIVFVSLEPWDEMWRRNQFVCDGLLRKSTDTKILFVQPPFDNSYALRTRKLNKIRQTPSIVDGGYSGRLKVFTPIKWFPNSLSVGRTWNEKHLISQIKRALRDLSWNATHLWINQHEAAHLLGAEIAPRSVYDITDDWTKFSGNQSHLDRIMIQDATLCKSCDHVIVCSKQLFDDKAKLVALDRLHLIPNGVHVEHYERVTDTSLPVHPIAIHWTKPVFGYTGTIHGDRVDVNLVASVAQTYPAATIAMVGPNLLDQREQKVLDRFSNIVFTGSQPYADLPDIMRAFDVCMVPHLVTPFTESLNPIKLWEYLAAGKPIVSTNVAGFREFANLVFVARTHEEFVKGLSAALATDKSRSSDRQAVALQHSWDSRLNDVLRILNG